jgi:hypothetical protein
MMQSIPTTYMEVEAAWSDDDGDHLKLRPADIPDDTPLHIVTKDNGDQFTVTAETLELILWVARPHTADDP